MYSLKSVFHFLLFCFVKQTECATLFSAITLMFLGQQNVLQQADGCFCTVFSFTGYSASSVET